jgi:hypothetical protein
MKPPALLVLLLLGATAAQADVPNAVTSAKPPGLRLVGYAGATADPLGSATFVIRKLSNVPMAGADVVIDFSACSDVRLSADALEPGFILDCDHRIIRGLTDAFGQITFRIVGAGNGAPPRALPACAAIYANGVLFPSLVASTFDLDGKNGVNVSDLSIAAGDLYSGSNRARSDFDFDGDVDGMDLGLLYRVMLRGGSSSSGAANCGP